MQLVRAADDSSLSTILFDICVCVQFSVVPHFQSIVPFFALSIGWYDGIRQYKSNCRMLVDKSVTYAVLCMRDPNTRVCLYLSHNPFIFTTFISNTMSCIFYECRKLPWTLQKKVDYVFFHFVPKQFIERMVLDECLKFDLRNISCMASEIRSLLALAELTHSIYW